MPKTLFDSICVSVLCVLSKPVIRGTQRGAFCRFAFVRAVRMWHDQETGSVAPKPRRWPTSFEAGRTSGVSVGSPTEKEDHHHAGTGRRARGTRIPNRSARSRAGSSGTATASKKTLLASEQDRPDIRQARQEWVAKRQPKMRLERHRLVFIDETGTNTKMTRLRGRCPKGQRLKAKAPFGHWKTQTFIAGLRCHGLTAPLSSMRR